MGDSPDDDILERVRRSEELYAKAFIQNPVAMTLTDSETQQFVAANQRFFELTGFWRAEVIGRTSAELGLWPDRAERDKVAQRLAEQAVFGLVQASVRMKDGRSVECLVGFQLIETDGRRFVLSVLAPMDRPDRLVP